MISLRSLLQTTAVLRELDLSNTASSPFKGTCMDNEIGSRGAQALALALEVNTSLTFVSAASKWGEISRHTVEISSLAV